MTNPFKKTLTSFKTQDSLVSNKMALEIDMKNKAEEFSTHLHQNKNQL